MATGTPVLRKAAPTKRWDALGRELDRARRYRRPLALVEIVPRASVGGGDGLFRRRRPGGSREANAQTLAFVRSFLRTGDEAWSIDDRIYVLLPEADPACAAGFVHRLRIRAEHVLITAEVRIATFPADGLTTGALLAALAPSRASRGHSGVPAYSRAGARATIKPRHDETAA